MSRERQERLAAIRREIERQNEEWRRTKAALARLGDVELLVPNETLEKLRAPAMMGTVDINAVRG